MSGPSLAFGSSRVAELEPADRRRCDLEDLLELRARHHHPRPRGARLTRVQHRVVHAARNRLLERRIVEHDEGRLAAELQRHLLDRLGRQRGHAPAGAHRAGEADHVDARMLRDRFAHARPVALDDVQHAGGQADLHGRFREQVAVERRQLRGLQHHGAAGGDRRRHLRHDLVQRKVPRRDQAGDAERLADDERVADLFLERGGLGERARSCA